MTLASSATPRSRDFRVFLSSNFCDFNEGRKLLARERGVEKVEVVLPSGVTQEKAQDGYVREICFQEIKRCRPYSVGMMGDNSRP